MVVPLLVAVMLLLATNLVVTFVLLKRRDGDSDNAANVLRAELRAAREEASTTASELRQEVSRTHQASTETLVKTISQIGGPQAPSGNGRRPPSRASQQQRTQARADA